MLFRSIINKKRLKTEKGQSVAISSENKIKFYIFIFYPFF